MSFRFPTVGVGIGEPKLFLVADCSFPLRPPRTTIGRSVGRSVVERLERAVEVTTRDGGWPAARLVPCWNGANWGDRRLIMAKEKEMSPSKRGGHRPADRWLWPADSYG